MKKFIEQNKQKYIDISDRIWDMPELKFEEYKTSRFQQETLKAEGFTITNPSQEMETAFIARYGDSAPVIGILGEFDALPGLGHGCGHNLLGTAGMLSAAAVKHYMKEHHLKGTICYYGCPGEETGAGKAFMVREGLFEDVDFCISWHPGAFNACAGETVANIHVNYIFDGVSSHASAAPECGRSALDAAELMNIGVNYLREHVTPDVRMHYAFTDAGGDAPNIVQPHVSMSYAVRAKSIQGTKEVYERVNKVARGAAMMTETEVTIEPFSAYANVLDNPTLTGVVQKYMEEMIPKEEIKTYVNTMISTDVGDVSWNVPTACFYLATAVKGTKLHTVQMAEQGKSEMSHEGMINAAQIMGGVAVELMTDAVLQKKVREDWKKAKADMEYECLIPKEIHPKSR